MYRGSIDLNLPNQPPVDLDSWEDLNVELTRIYNAIRNLLIGYDLRNSELATYDANTTYGQVVNVYNSGGSHARLAKADSATTFAVAMCVKPEGVSASKIDYTCALGVVKNLSGLTPGAIYYLSDTVAGAITAAKPVTVGHIVQIVGVALSASTLYFNPQPSWTVL